jgi:hypothetical protein
MERQEAGGLGWLAVAVAVLLVLIVVLGTMAEDRWCGPALCQGQM